MKRRHTRKRRLRERRILTERLYMTYEEWAVFNGYIVDGSFPDKFGAAATPDHPARTAIRAMEEGEQVWGWLRAAVSSSTEFTGWSRARGETSLRFRVMEIRDDHLKAVSNTAASPVRISRKHFLRVFVVWDGYCSGKLPRNEITSLVRSTSYIFGILRWWQVSQDRARAK